MDRFSYLIRRLLLACALAGTAGAAVVMGLGLSTVPRAVLALHPVVTLMGLALVRIVYRMTYEHARSRIAGHDGEVRRAVVLGAGDAARLLLAGVAQQGWVVLGLLDDDPGKQGARINGVPVRGPLQALAVQAVLTLEVRPQGEAAEPRASYRVAGAPEAGLDKLAPVVDRVLGEQWRRLASHLEGQARR